MPDEKLDPKKIIEAALFMSQNYIGIDELGKVTGIASPGHIEKMLNELMEQYRNGDTALEIVEIGGKYSFTLKEPYLSRVNSLAPTPEISKGALKILAYISKNENVMQSELVKIFGETTYEYIRELREKEFVEAKKYGRSRKIATTLKFKEYFGV
ncbi:MAG: SMC-Scp complex subunit ScpB [Candidatus Micrarchaeia archaeon]